MKNYVKNLGRDAKRDYIGTAALTVVFFAVLLMKNGGMLSRSQTSWLVPICSYIVMAVSLNLTVGVLGELSLGHAGFMSVGAFSGIIVSQSLLNAVPSEPVRLLLAIVIGAIFAGLVGFLVGIPVLRLRGDYLAIVTLAFGEIIKDLITCLIVGVDSRGLHFIFNVSGSRSANDLDLLEGGRIIIKGAQGATGTTTIAGFGAGFILILVSLLIILNLIRSRTGRAVLAIRDNRIAAESLGIHVTRYKMTAFVISAALAGAAGALYGLNYSNLLATKFDFNLSILVLVYVVLGGLGNIWGSIIAAVILYILPEALRAFSSYRMLLYAIVLILVMLATNNNRLKELLKKLNPFRRKGGEDLG